MLKKFIEDEQGMETVEWAVLAALIVAALIVTIKLLGQNVLNAFNRLKSATDPA
jgi:Flp pilus assembly pilin Flp